MDYRRLFLFLLLATPAVVCAQTIEAGVEHSTSAPRESLKDKYLSEDGHVEFFQGNGEGLKTSSFWIELSSGQKRMVYISSDEKGILRSVKIIEGKTGEYELNLDSTGTKINFFGASF